MTKVREVAILAALTTLVASAFSQVPVDAKRTAVNLFGPDLSVNGPPEDEAASKDNGELKVVVKRAGSTPFTVQIQTSNNRIPVHPGDVLLVTFEGRSTSRNGGVWQMHAQQSESPWYGYFNSQGMPDLQWRRFNVNWTADREIRQGSMDITFHVASQAQELEFRNFEAVDLGRYSGKLPFTPISYPGREADAPWRKKAEDQIDRYRKADITVRVTDAAGRPMSGARVHIRQLRHAYEFGSFLESPLLAQNEDGKRYRDWFLRAYNKATTPMYWADWGWENPEEHVRYLQYPQWLKDHGIVTKAHVLIYPGWGFMPARVKQYDNDPVALWKVMEAHIREKLAAVKRFGFVSWDVTNETRDLRDLPKVFGSEEIYVRLYKLAHEIDPKPILFLNENTILTQGGRTDSQQAEFERMISYLLSHGAPLQGIGMQAHFGEVLTSPEEIWRIVDRFAKFGLPIQITEFDLPIQDKQAQADYTRDLLTAWFADPATTGFTMWGFWEGSMWQPAGALVDRHWNVLPNGQAWLDLVKKRWWTDVEVVTDTHGIAKTRAFKGDYEIASGAVQKKVSVTTATAVQLTP